MPAHGIDRAEERLLGLRDYERLSVTSGPALTITSDDGDVNNLQTINILDQLYVKGTIAVSPEFVGQSSFLSYPALRSIMAAGHEVAYHGIDHHPLTGFRNQQDLTAASREGLARLQDQYLSATTLIYPCGNNNRAVRAAIAPLFRCALTTWYGVNHRTVNRYAIRRIPFGAYSGNPSPSEKSYCELIDAATRDNYWIILMLHPGASEHTGEHNKLLPRLIQYARERGVPIRSVTEHLDIISPISADNVIGHQSYQP